MKHIVPDFDWDYARYVKEVKKVGKKMLSDVRHCGEPAVQAEYSEFLMSIARFRRLPKHDQCAGCALPAGVFEDAVHMLLYLLPMNVRSVLEQYALVLPFLRHMCRHEAVEFLKSVTGLIRGGGTYIHVDWRFISYWERFFGYRDYKTAEDLNEEIEDWLVDRKKLGGPLGEDCYYDMMYHAVKDGIKKSWRKMSSDKFVTLDKYVKQARWIRGKAGTGSKATVFLEGKRHVTSRRKGLDAVFYDDDEIKNQIRTFAPDKLFIAQKSEHGKIRPVVKTTNEANRRMDYLVGIIEYGLSRVDFTHVFSGALKAEQEDTRMLVSTCANTLKLPMDHSHFDHYQTKESMMAVLAAVYDVAVNHVPPEHVEEWKQIWSVMWRALFSRVTVEFKGRTWQWTNGLPSGLRITSLLGTLLNYASSSVASDLVRSYRLSGRDGGSAEVRVLSKLCQGDDISVELSTVEEGDVLLTAMGALGYKVHPQKTYISRDRTEFLQRSFEPGSITGYLSRLFLGIRFRSPILEPPLIRAERLFSRFMIWQLAMLRGADIGRAIDAFLMEAAALKVERGDAIGFMLTPRAYGGMGVATDSEMGMRVMREWDGQWRRLRVYKPVKKRKMHLGQWARRIRDVGLVLDETNRDEIEAEMLTSWGIRQAAIYSDVSFDFVRFKPISPIYENPGNPAIRADEVWDMEEVPVLLRSHLKRQNINDGDWRNIKPQYVEYVRWVKRRVSRSVFEGWLMGEFRIGLQMIDHVAVKYGAGVKNRLDAILHRYMLKKDMTLQRLERIMHYWELKGTKMLRQWAGPYTYAV